MGNLGRQWNGAPLTPARLALIRCLNRPLAPPGLKEWLKAAGRIGPGGSPSPSSTLSALHADRHRWCVWSSRAIGFASAPATNERARESLGAVLKRTARDDKFR